MPSNQSDKDTIKSKWHEIQPKILSHWKKLSAFDVEQTKGDKESLKALIASNYGNASDFDRLYEKFCSPLKEKTSTDVFNELDDEDEEGMRRFDKENADYTGLALSDAEQIDLLKPDLKGMDASDAQTLPDLKNEHKKIKHNHTAPDEFKPNQDPRSKKSEDITLGRSNSSANTTSSSALISSGANKKL